MNPLLIACDFDGTITERDTLHVIVEAFGRPGVWAELEPHLVAGRISVEEAMEEQFACVNATPEEVAARVRAEAPIRPGFAQMVAWCRAEGHELVVVSAGFRSVIERVLDDAGIAGLEVVSNEALFSREGCRLVWSERGERCVLCGRRCKRHVLGLRWDGQTLVYLGDGMSDRCAAEMADLVFARAGLADHLDGVGHPYVPLEDFFQVRRELETLLARAA